MQANSSPTRRMIFVFHITGSLSQLLLFTYSCDALIEESTNVGSAIYSGPWIHLPMDRIGKMLRKDLTIIIVRSRKPCCLTASGFFPVSLETCTKVPPLFIFSLSDILFSLNFDTLCIFLQEGMHEMESYDMKCFRYRCLVPRCRTSH